MGQGRLPGRPRARRPRSRRRSSTSCAPCSARRRSSSARGGRRGGQDATITEAEVREALQRLDPLWDELFPAEQARIVQLLVERVDVRADGPTCGCGWTGVGLVRELPIADGMAA